MKIAGLRMVTVFATRRNIFPFRCSAAYTTQVLAELCFLDAILLLLAF